MSQEMQERLERVLRDFLFGEFEIPVIESAIRKSLGEGFGVRVESQDPSKELSIFIQEPGQVTFTLYKVEFTRTGVTFEDVINDGVLDEK